MFGFRLSPDLFRAAFCFRILFGPALASFFWVPLWVARLLPGAPRQAEVTNKMGQTILDVAREQQRSAVLGLFERYGHGLAAERQAAPRAE